MVKDNPSNLEEDQIDFKSAMLAFRSVQFDLNSFRFIGEIHTTLAVFALVIDTSY